MCGASLVTGRVEPTDDARHCVEISGTAKAKHLIIIDDPVHDPRSPVYDPGFYKRLLDNYVHGGVRPVLAMKAQMRTIALEDGPFIVPARPSVEFSDQTVEWETISGQPEMNFGIWCTFRPSPFRPSPFVVMDLCFENLDDCPPPIVIE